MSWPTFETTENERFLERQLQDAQAELERRRRESQENIQRSREEARERQKSYYREADSWPDALRKQSHLMAGEAGPQGYEGENWKHETDYFAEFVDACNRALEIWNVVEESQSADKAKLLAQLEAIEMTIRRAVSDKLLSERETQGWVSVANTLADLDANPSDWLNW